MRTKRNFAGALLLALAWSCSSDEPANNGPGKSDASADSAVQDASQDAHQDAASDSQADTGHDGSAPLPRLGVYTVKVDGTDLQLLVDPGTKQLTHVRPGPNGWFTATRYNEDNDNNGLAMEGEGGTSPHYGKTEVVVFERSAPKAVTVIAGGTPSRLCANSSWTADGKLLYLHQDDPITPGRSRFKRATFATIPAVATTVVVEVPPEVFPVDPYQWGPSDGTGFIVFPGVCQHASGFMRPVWRMPASGAKTVAELQLLTAAIDNRSHYPRIYVHLTRPISIRTRSSSAAGAAGELPAPAPPTKL